MENKVLAGILVYFCLLIALSSFVNSEEGASKFCGTHYSCEEDDNECIHHNKIIYSTDDLLFTYMSLCSLKSPYLFFTYLTRPVYTLSYLFYALQFGFNYFTPRIMNSIFSACVLILTYLLSKRFIKDKLLSVLPVLLVALHPLYLLLSVSGFSDILFMFAILLGVNLWYQKNYSLSTIVISLTPLIRPEGFALLIWWVVLNFRKKKNILILFFPTFLYFLGNLILFGDFFYYVKYPFITIVGGVSNETEYGLIHTLREYASVFGLPVSLMFLFGFLKNFLNKEYWVVIGCVLSILLVQNLAFATGSNRLLDRYTLLIFPFIALFASNLLYDLTKFLDENLLNRNFKEISNSLSSAIKLLVCFYFILHALFILQAEYDNQNKCKGKDFVFSNSGFIGEYIDKIKRLSSEYDDVHIHRLDFLGQWFNFGDLLFVDTNCSLIDTNLVPCYITRIKDDRIELYFCFLFNKFEVRYIEEPKIFQKSDCNEEFCIDGGNDVFIPQQELIDKWFNK